MFKAIYLKCIDLAGHKNSKFFLGFISFIESFIFPIPPDVIIIPMTIAKRKQWIKIALIATIGSVLGACLGYFIGYIFFNEIGIKIFEFYGVDPSFWKNKVSSEGGVFAWITLLAIAGFSPVPFKLLNFSKSITILVGKERLELSQYYYHWILSPTRLPVPPFAHLNNFFK